MYSRKPDLAGSCSREREGFPGDVTLIQEFAALLQDLPVSGICCPRIAKEAESDTKTAMTHVLQLAGTSIDSKTLLT